MKSNGKISISGGDTNPAEGKVLMASNENGDATWQSISQNPKIGFSIPLIAKVIPNMDNSGYFDHFLDFGTPIFVDDEGWNNAINPLVNPNQYGKFYVIEDGVYLLKFDMAWTTDNPNSTNLTFVKNSGSSIESTFFKDTKGGNKFGLNTIAKLSQGNYVEVQVYHSAPSSLTVSSTFPGRFSVVKLY